MLKESDIRPPALLDEQRSRYEADVRRLLEQRGTFVHVCCPACGGSDGEGAWAKYALTYERCAACRTVYLSPRPPPGVLADY